MWTRGVATVTVLLVVVAGLSGAGGAIVTDRPEQQGEPAAVAGSQVDADTVLLRADVAADGSASWEMSYLVALEDDNDTQAFEELAADIEENESRYTSQFAERMERTVASAAEATGREMAVEDVGVTTERQELGQEYGVVTYTFTWRGFAAVDGEAIEVGDALGGFFLDSETQLTVAWPDGYEVVSVSPDPAEQRTDAVVWQGELDFGSEGPRLLLSSDAGTQGGGDGAGGGGPPWLLVAAAVGLGALAGLGFAYRRGLFDDDGTGAPAATAPGSGSGGAGGAVDGTADDGAEDGEDEPPEELLSNEERVLKLLEEEGGRIKQKEVAERLDWTAAKTSQVVGDLHDEGEVDKFRLGRENVLTLPDEDDM